MAQGGFFEIEICKSFIKNVPSGDELCLAGYTQSSVPGELTPTQIPFLFELGLPYDMCFVKVSFSKVIMHYAFIEIYFYFETDALMGFVTNLTLGFRRNHSALTYNRRLLD